HWGLRKTIYAKVMNALKRIVGLHVFSVHTGHYEADDEIPALPLDLEVHLLTAPEIRSRVGVRHLDFRELAVTAPLARGDLCIGAFSGDKLVAYTWRALRGPVPHTGGWEVVWNPGLVYRYKAFTLPDYRGLHIHEVLSKTIDRYLL